MKHVLVTGGAGFIGSQLVKRLEQDPEVFVTVIDKSHNFCNLRQFRGNYISSDVCGWSLRQSILPVGKPPEVIYHMSGVTMPQESNNLEIYDNNIASFTYVAEFAEAFQTTVVYASSAGVYGNGPTPMHEESELDPLTYYAWSKMIIENSARIRNQKTGYGGSQFIGLRYFNVYGPGECCKVEEGCSSPIAKFIDDIDLGMTPTLYVDSHEMIRSFVHIDDVVDVTLAIAKSGTPGTYNVGYDLSYSFQDVYDVVAAALEHKNPPRIIEMPEQMAETYQFKTVCNSTKLFNEIGFAPRISLTQGVKMCVKPKEKNHG